MDPRMMEILQKSAAIDKAAKKFDTTPIKGGFGNGGSNNRPSRGLYEDMDTNMGTNDMVPMTEEFQVTNPMGGGADGYGEAVDNSGLPPEIKAAMKMNPIQQPDTVSSDFSEEDVRKLRGINESEEAPYYNDDDENDFDEQPVKLTRKPKRQQIREEYTTEQNVSPELIKKLVNEEIKKILPKILPKVVEHYLQKGLMKENLDILRKIKPSKRR